MIKTVEIFIRGKIKEGLDKLPEKNINIFKRLYGSKGGTRSLEETLAMDHYLIVEEIECSRLELALDQIERTLAKHEQ